MLVICAEGAYVIEDDGTIRTPGSSLVTTGHDAGLAIGSPGRWPARRPPSGGPVNEHPGGSPKAE